MNLVALDDEVDVEVLYKHFFFTEIAGEDVNFFFYSDPQKFITNAPSLSGNIFLLTDMQMPMMNGLEVIKNLHGIRSDYQVFIISANAIDLSDQDKATYHVREVLLKPLNFTLLRQKVLEYL